MKVQTKFGEGREMNNDDFYQGRPSQDQILFPFEVTLGDVATSGLKPLN